MVICSHSKLIEMLSVIKLLTVIFYLKVLPGGPYSQVFCNRDIGELAAASRSTEWRTSFIEPMYDILEKKRELTYLSHFIHN